MLLTHWILQILKHMSQLQDKIKFKEKLDIDNGLQDQTIQIQSLKAEQGKWIVAK